jgi:ElaB/YqjD/DUF883 family membrane-anchored ribosome-binding protein
LVYRVIRALGLLAEKSNGGYVYLNRLSNDVAGASPRTLWMLLDHLGETIASAFSNAADRFRRRARSVGNEAEKVSGQAADLGKDILQRLSHEVEHRPLVAIAVAIGVGILIGLASKRR